MLKLFLNRPALVWLMASLAGVLAYLFHAPWIANLHKVFVEQLPGALLSVMGFILAAATIVVSVRNQGLLKVFADVRPDLWNKLMAQFFVTAKTSGIYALYLLLLGQASVQTWQNTIAKVIQSVSIFGFVLLVLQIATAIYAMEVASKTSSSSLKPEKDDANYNIPTDVSIPTYQEPKK